MKMNKTAIILGSICMLAGAQMAQAAVMNYNVTQTYNQIVYDGTLEIDTVFTGSFSYDTVSQSVSNLSGSLSQAMTEAMGMTWQSSDVGGEVIIFPRKPSFTNLGIRPLWSIWACVRNRVLIFWGSKPQSNQLRFSI